jgi:hypothetical protein
LKLVEARTANNDKGNRPPFSPTWGDGLEGVKRRPRPAYFLEATGRGAWWANYLTGRVRQVPLNGLIPVNIPGRESGSIPARSEQFHSTSQLLV